MQEILWAIEENDGELSPELESLLEQTEQSRAERFEACLAALQNLEGEALMFKQEADRLKEIAVKRAKAAESLENYIAHNLEEKEKIATRYGTCSIRFSESVETIPGEEIPEQYLNIKTVAKPDLRLIKESIKEGAELPFARIVKNRNLAIK
jgi:hypothetical protein